MTQPEILAVVSFLVVALMAITFHEASHAYMAHLCGDDTAKNLGRVSFNPLKHIDLIGTILLPGLLFAVHAPFLFGWAKPVPVNYARLRNVKRDMMFVAAAGPGANFVLALASVAAGAVTIGLNGPQWLVDALGASLWLNLVLGVFNLIPIPPLDGSKVLAGMLPDAWAARFLGLGRRRPKQTPPPVPDEPPAPPRMWDY
ncbi:MAG: site-2 protease family protein [Alphaproteobacteria bacterium]|nr:site-2 protease family protein [Alphaproteobacteria bacterium]MDE2112341.1 site-2 protease family protein [Alphaproteobacteria bacterium]MDE2492835.1 site-2 protease family protein [Alphaproteobacteria bacterium]